MWSMKGVPFSLSFIIFVICDFEFQVHLSPLKAWCFSFFLFFFQQFNWLLIRVGHISRWPRRVLIGYSVGLGNPLSCHIISSWSVFVGLIIGGFHSSSSSISFLFQSFHLVNSHTNNNLFFRFSRANPPWLVNLPCFVYHLPSYTVYLFFKRTDGTVLRFLFFFGFPVKDSGGNLFVAVTLGVCVLWRVLLVYFILSYLVYVR